MRFLFATFLYSSLLSSFPLSQGDLVHRSRNTWAFTLANEKIPRNVVLQTELTILKPSSKPRYFPEDPPWNDYQYQALDPGYDGGVVVGDYRVQVSYKYQEVALYKKTGGYLFIASTAIPLRKPLLLKVENRKNRVRVWYQNILIIDYEDPFDPSAGEKTAGVGAYRSKVLFKNTKIEESPLEPLLVLAERVYQMSYRKWHGAQWIFCDSEPIARFHPKTGKLVEMKLRPGVEPQLQAQLAWMEANPLKVPQLNVSIQPGTENSSEIKFSIKGRVQNPAASTKNILSVGYDEKRKTYSYDFLGEAEAENTALDFNYLFPYNTTAKLPSVSPYHWEIFKGNDGLLYRSPIRNDWENGAPITRVEGKPVARPHRPYFQDTAFQVGQKAGNFLMRGLHPFSNPALLFVEDMAGGEPASRMCPYSLETYLGVKKPTSKKLRVHYRFLSFPPEEAVKLFMQAKLPTNLVELHDVRLVEKEGIHQFRPPEQLARTEPLNEKCLAGTYHVDPWRGLDDRYSVVLNPHEWIQFHLPQEKTTLHFFAKTEKEEDLSKLSVKSLTDSSSLTLKLERKEVDDGWTHFEVQVHGTPNGKIEFYHSGRKRLWLDNVEWKKDPQDFLSMGKRVGRDSV